MTNARVGLVIALSMISGPPAAGMQTRVRPAAPRVLPLLPECPDCRVVVDTIATLRFPLGIVPEQQLPSSAATNSRGELFLVFQGDTSGVFVFDTTGVLVHRIRPTRRAAKAPPQFSVLVDPLDSVVVVDNERSTFSLYTPDLRLARQGSFGATWLRDAERLESGEFAVSADVQTPRSIGMPLHRVAASGALLSSFGAPDTLFIDRGVAEFAHSLTLARSGGFWTATRANVRVRRWSSEFELADDIVFANGSPRSFGLKANRTDLAFVRPQLITFQEDSCSRLLLLSHAPATGTGDPGIEMSDVGGRRMPRVRHPDRTFQSIIELIDPVKTRYIASLSVPVNLFKILPDGRALAIATNDRGEWHTTIVAIRVTPDPSLSPAKTNTCLR